MKIALANGSTVVDYPLIEQSVVSHSAERIVIDEGKIRIDSANHTLDEAHLVLDGVLTSGQNYFKILKSGQTLLNCDHTGQLHCHQDITAPVISGMLTEITNLQTSDTTQNTAIANNTAEISNSTHQSTHDTLVKRNNNDTTSFHDITSNIISINQALALYGDAALTYTPQDQNGINISGYTYRFGRNTEELSDFSGIGNGVELKEPSGNQIIIQVNQSTPTIELQVNKSNAEPYILARNTASEKIIQINEHGISQRYDVFALNQLTPGTLFETTALINGPQVHRFELFSAWTEQISESIIEIISAELQSTTEHRIIENLDICLDDLSVVSGVSDIHSRVFVKRWGQYRNTVQRLYIVVGCDFHNNETQLDANSQVRISFNNKLVL